MLLQGTENTVAATCGFVVGPHCHIAKGFKHIFALVLMPMCTH